jgi:hypothetical protein
VLRSHTAVPLYTLTIRCVRAQAESVAAEKGFEETAAVVKEWVEAHPAGEAAPEAEAEAEPEAEAEAEPEAEAEAEPEAEAEAEPEAEAEAEPEAEGEAEPEAEGEAEPEAEGEAEPEAEGEAEPEAEGEAEPEAEGEAEPEAEGEAEPEGEPEPESGETSAVANVSITAEELLASFAEEGADEAAAAELHDRFMGLWQEKRADSFVSMKEVRWIYGVEQPETLTEEEIVELEKQPEPLTEEELIELERQQAAARAEAERRAILEAERARQEELLNLYKEALQERENIVNANKELQGKVIARLTSLKKDTTPKPEEGGGGFSEKSTTDKEATYEKILSVVDDLREELFKTESENDEKTLVLKEQRDAKDGEASTLEKEFADFKREVAKDAVNSRTGKSIPAKLIAHFEELEREKEGEVEKVRLKNISHRTTLKKLESTLKKKEELAKGLPLIDFEQLKIENQTLNEKIEDMNEQLLKLRKKTTATVQVLTHIKEKLQFVQQEVAVQKEKLEVLDGEVSHHRDLLTHLKHERDRLRAENQKLKQQGGLMYSDGLLEDFEGREEATIQLTERLTYLKAKHAEYTNIILAANQASANVAAGMGMGM